MKEILVEDGMTHDYKVPLMGGYIEIRASGSLDGWFLVNSEYHNGLVKALEEIQKLVRTPSNGRHAYTHFMADFDAIRKICRAALAAAALNLDTIRTAL